LRFFLASSCASSTILDTTFRPGRDDTFMAGVRQRGADVLKIMIDPDDR
jgi:hypothetical protein